MDAIHSVSVNGSDEQVFDTIVQDKVRRDKAVKTMLSVDEYKRYLSAYNVRRLEMHPQPYSMSDFLRDIIFTAISTPSNEEGDIPM